MKKSLLALVSLAALMAASPSGATVLTFDGNICNDVGGACGDGALLDQAYGDAVGVDVQTRYDSTGAADGPNALRFWGPSYSDLTNVAWGTPSANGASIFLAAVGGSSITLNSFSLGAWPNTDRGTSYSIFDGLGNTLFSSGPLTIDGTISSLFNVGLTSSTGLGIKFGPDSFNVGIDNIDFSVAGIGAVPEPASWALMIAGFGLVGSAMRRRKPSVSVSFA